MALAALVAVNTAMSVNAADNQQESASARVAISSANVPDPGFVGNPFL